MPTLEQPELPGLHIREFTMSVVIGSIALIGFVTLLASYACVFLKLGQKSAEPKSCAPVSILKPLKGVDEGLYENLAAIAAQDYPVFEVLFCAEDPKDPALVVARQVQADFPHTAIRVLSGAAADGLNPKVRILRRLMAAASYEWLLVSDSNVRPGRAYLRELRGYQETKNADLVSTVLCGVGERSVGARLENLQLNSWVAAAVCMPEMGGHPCVIGKTMFLRRTALEVVGGFEDVRDILAEDYTLGHRFHEAGFSVVVSPYVLPVISGTRDVTSFFNRHLRWGQMRRRISPLSFLLELVVQPTPWFLASLALGDPSWSVVAIAALAIKYATEAYLYWRLDGRAPLATLVWIPFKDILVFIMWFGSATRTTVQWRGNRMRIGPESRLTLADAPVGEMLENIA